MKALSLCLFGYLLMIIVFFITSIKIYHLSEVSSTERFMYLSMVMLSLIMFIASLIWSSIYIINRKDVALNAVSIFLAIVPIIIIAMNY